MLGFVIGNSFLKRCTSSVRLWGGTESRLRSFKIGTVPGKTDRLPSPLLVVVALMLFLHGRLASSSSSPSSSSPSPVFSSLSPRSSLFGAAFFMFARHGFSSMRRFRCSSRHSAVHQSKFLLSACGAWDLNLTNDTNDKPNQPLSVSSADFFFFSSDLARLSVVPSAAWLDLGSSEVALRVTHSEFPNLMPRDVGRDRRRRATVGCSRSSV